ncbi:MAG: UDP-N-acetylmuramoyl-tripeptide--D-alanyl-D-alanine ligase [Oscillospiraceae bacterium]
MTIRQISQAVGQELNDDRTAAVITTDSREITPDSVFIALKGESFNGNDFAADAVAKGALLAIVDEERDYNTENILIVKNTGTALLDIAEYYRSLFSPKIVAVTGSVGKTTTKEFIWTVLESRYKTIKTEGNQNNQIGLPKTIFNIDETTEAAVVEMGMSGFGEIEELVMAARPDIAVITNIGVSHIEHLGSRDNILKAKLEITKGLKHGAPLILCGDNDLLAEVKDERFKIITYGIKNEDVTVRAVSCRQNGTQTEFEILFGQEKYHVSIPCTGEHNVLNALAAFTVGLFMHIEPLDAAKALANYVPVGMRQNIVQHNNFTVVEDCYNASPDSMEAAVKAFAAMACKGRRIIVLSDMLELGTISEQEHYKVGKQVAQNPIHILVCTGKFSEQYMKGATDAGLQEAFHFANKDELTEFLKGNVQEDDILWFKASRGMKLEDVIKRIYEEC